jgi:hypothetical protein
MQFHSTKFCAHNITAEGEWLFACPPDAFAGSTQPLKLERIRVGKVGDGHRVSVRNEKLFSYKQVVQQKSARPVLCCNAKQPLE